jgi:hypothetical protein
MADRSQAVRSICRIVSRETENSAATAGTGSLNRLDEREKAHRIEGVAS